MRNSAFFCSKDASWGQGSFFCWAVIFILLSSCGVRENSLSLPDLDPVDQWGKGHLDSSPENQSEVFFQREEARKTQAFRLFREKNLAYVEHYDLSPQFVSKYKKAPFANLCTYYSTTKLVEAYCYRKTQKHYEFSEAYIYLNYLLNSSSGHVAERRMAPLLSKSWGRYKQLRTASFALNPVEEKRNWLPLKDSLDLTGRDQASALFALDLFDYGLFLSEEALSFDEDFSASVSTVVREASVLPVHQQDNFVYKELKKLAKELSLEPYYDSAYWSDPSSLSYEEDECLKESFKVLYFQRINLESIRMFLKAGLPVLCTADVFYSRKENSRLLTHNYLLTGFRKKAALAAREYLIKDPYVENSYWNSSIPECKEAFVLMSSEQYSEFFQKFLEK